MANNQHLSNAKSAKNDEFYTQYHDVEIEVNAHMVYDDVAVYKYLCQAEPDGLEMLSDEEQEAFEKKCSL